MKKTLTMAIAATAAGAAMAIGTVAPANAAGTVTIKGPKTATVNTKFTINCTAPKTLAGGTVVLYHNGEILPLATKVAKSGSCNFKVKSSKAGVNTFDVAVRKGGKVYQADAIKVTIKGKSDVVTKNTVKISGPKTAKQWERITVKCKAPTAAEGGKLFIFQNGELFPYSKYTVSSGGQCKFWLQSGIVGPNRIDIAVKKGSKTYQSNSILINVTSDPS